MSYDVGVLIFNQVAVAFFNF